MERNATDIERGGGMCASPLSLPPSAPHNEREERVHETTIFPRSEREETESARVFSFFLPSYTTEQGACDFTLAHPTSLSHTCNGGEKHEREIIMCTSHLLLLAHTTKGETSARINSLPHTARGEIGRKMCEPSLPRNVWEG